MKSVDYKGMSDEQLEGSLKDLVKNQEVGTVVL